MYGNPLSVEMENYLNLLDKAGRYTLGVKGLFNELEVVIPKHISKEEALSSIVLFEWDRRLTGSPVTRKRKYSEIRGFMNFLQSTGLAYRIPETPRTQASGYACLLYTSPSPR